MVRCANNGLTCWMDSHGRMHAVHFPGAQNTHQEGFKIIQLALRNPGQKRRLTFYGRYGDWYGWTCLTVSMGLGLLRFTRARRSKAFPFAEGICKLVRLSSR